MYILPLYIVEYFMANLQVEHSWHRGSPACYRSGLYWWMMCIVQHLLSSCRFWGGNRDDKSRNIQDDVISGRGCAVLWWFVIAQAHVLLNLIFYRYNKYPLSSQHYALTQGFYGCYCTPLVLWFPKGTQGFIRCLFNAASSATLNKQMLSSLATYDALSLVITNPSFIWFGSRSVDICTALVNSWYRRGHLHFLVCQQFGNH